jgi:hypothetical protein
MRVKWVVKKRVRATIASLLIPPVTQIQKVKQTSISRSNMGMSS